MNPKYKFELITEYGGGVTTTNPVAPLYDNNVSKDYEQEQGEQFFRAKLNGKLTFVGMDKVLIDAAPFESQFIIVVSISWDRGLSWAEYWRGEFYKTDCKFDNDNASVEVTPSPIDAYTDIMAGLDKEFDLIALRPEIERLTLSKRPMLQIYVPGESVITCLAAGMSWEQDCEEVTNENELAGKYKFALMSLRTGDQAVTGSGVADGMWIEGESPDGRYEWSYETKEEDGEFFEYTYLTRKSDGVKLFANRNYQETPAHRFTMYAVGDERQEPVVTVTPIIVTVYGRYLLDIETIYVGQTFPVPADDMVENNRNYRRVLPYDGDIIYYSAETTSEPNEYGIKQPGEYWKPPTTPGDTPVYPVGRSHWAEYSIWCTLGLAEDAIDVAGRKEYVLQNAYPLHAVISVLLAQIAPGITHEATSSYSQFLYDSVNPISGDSYGLYITPKSNILAGEYTQPAQKAPITLRMITDMLRECFCAYWHVEAGRFVVEHIKYYKNGGRYVGSPAISHDLTAEYVTRNRKAWAYETSQYEYEKIAMPERYQFGWMDDVTLMFKGNPIDVISKFAEKGNIEDVTVRNFTTDVDYMLMNPGACSPDGFALLAGIPQEVATPDNDWREVPIGAYDIVYPLLAKGGESIRIRLAARISGVVLGELCFLDEGGHAIERIWTINGEDEELTLDITTIIPVEATQMGVRQSTRTGTMEVKLLSVIGAVKVPFIVNTIGAITADNQNGFLAFVNLQGKYHLYNMPSYDIRLNGVEAEAYGIMRGKRQEVQMPVINDPDPMLFVKTFLGNGQIKKFSVNLSSRAALVTLVYDTFEKR